MNPENDLLVARTALPLINEHVRFFGQQDVETGAFLLARRDQNTLITTVAFAGIGGVIRARDQFRISGRAIEQLFNWSDEQDLQVRAQLHSHPGDAFLSESDSRFGFRVAGFQTSIIPEYADPPLSPGAWGWWVFQAEKWIPIPAPALTDGHTRRVRFDEHGVDAY